VKRKIKAQKTERKVSELKGSVSSQQLRLMLDNAIEKSISPNGAASVFADSVLKFLGLKEDYIIKNIKEV